MITAYPEYQDSEEWQAMAADPVYKRFIITALELQNAGWVLDSLVPQHYSDWYCCAHLMDIYFLHNSQGKCKILAHCQHCGRCISV